MNIVCFGDSITQGHDLGDDQRWTGLLAQALPAHTVVNRGVGGNTTAMALERLASEVLPLLPGIVIVEFGLNDGSVVVGSHEPRTALAVFRAQLADIITRCRAAGGTCLLVANHRVAQPAERQGNGLPRQDNVAAYNAAIREPAQVHAVACVDVAAVVAAKGIDATSLLHEDGVHLSPAGNRIYAAIIRTALAPLLIGRPPLAMVAAMARNRVIGNAGQLPWHEPADLAHFKRTTSGHAVIMGRKTWESLGKPLPKRRNLVVTRQPGFSAPGAEVFADLTQAIAAARSSDGEPMIIGGGEIYAVALSQATRIELTEIAAEPVGDAHFPVLGPDWVVADERTAGQCTFRTWVRA